MSASRPQPPAKQSDDALDEALEETFPASDPIAIAPSSAPAPEAPRTRKQSHHPEHPQQPHSGKH